MVVVIEPLPKLLLLSCSVLQSNCYKSLKEAAVDPTRLHLSITTRYSVVADFCVVDNMLFIGSVKISNYT